LGRFNQPGCEADSFLQSVSEVKNAWTFTFTRPYVRMKHRDSFTVMALSNNWQACEIVMEVDG